MISMRPLVLLLAPLAAFAADPSIGKKLVFSDDFNGDKIDESKWNVVGSREVFSLVKVGKENALRIGLKVKDDMIQTNMLTSRGKFSQQFGYFEASMRMHAGDGHAGTFRIITDDEKTPPSITTSFHGTGKERVSPWARAVMESGFQDFRPEKSVGKFTDLSKKFHTYGILWTEKGFTWYMDGKAVHKLERKEFVRPMSLALTHRIEEQDRPRLVVKTLPDDVDIDWVKVWK
jgi:beta-glucanase (GH16 family)